ncbi:hypothetical protein NPIL_547981 [Nephila pilipes]|uniref:Uncharacterized protein n=1 Tax=Nephila pilipes TaxID=299642 RepID=A0A8X6PUP3_NEPPI|nr:hypothetical protein NPIL_547981 [Nephila pilipes]
MEDLAFKKIIPVFVTRSFSSMSFKAVEKINRKFSIRISQQNGGALKDECPKKAMTRKHRTTSNSRDCISSSCRQSIYRMLTPEEEKSRLHWREGEKQ